MKRTFLIVVLILLGFALGIVAIAYLINLEGDRQAVITITGPVQVYDRESPPGFMRGGEGVIQSLHQGDPAKVLSIHEHRGFEAIRVRLRDGREGYIFCCENFVITR